MTVLYSEFRAYSPLADCEIARISVADDRGSEFFMFVKDIGYGKHYRETLVATLDQICAAMDRGVDPGEVKPS